MCALKHFHQQAQPGGLADIAGNLGAIHPEFACLQLVGLHLFVRDLLEGFLDQVLPTLFLVFHHPLAEVVDRAHIKITLPQLMVPQRITYLHIKQKGCMKTLIEAQ